ncbi:MAG TPA: NHLP bacteriocin export ABC transporter permease/ATPase subunit [Rubrobacter sp.]|nr:NHLP bacteriocin export ABC transporter permease/ATPase subunit [Rubrobacter sp.]
MPPEEMMPEGQQWLLRLGDQKGRRIEAGGNAPISLDDPDSVFVVSSGKVDVFSTQADVGQIMGPRRHLCRVTAGQVLFGIDLGHAPEEFGILAVGVADTVLIGLRRSELAESTKGTVHAGLVGALLEGWLEKLSSAVAVQHHTPRESRTLAPGQKISIDADETVRAEQNTVWVRHLDGSSRFLGDADLPPVGGDGLFPLSDPAWLASGGGTALEGVGTVDYVAGDASWSGLDSFHAVVVSALDLETRLSFSERRELEDERESADVELARSAVNQLGSVLEKDAFTEDDDQETPTGDPLLAACQVIGRRLGVELRRPAWSDGTARDPLEEIARASRVRIRRVALKGDWWRRDSGPLLCFREDESPVALLQRGTSAYTIVDPARGTSDRVTGETAAELADFAYTFYPPFPDRPLGAWDLLKYSLRNLRGDLLRVSLMGVAGGLLGALVPIVTKQIVDIAIPQAEGGFAVALALGLAVAAVSAMLFEMTRQFAVLRIETKLDSGVQAAVWDRLLSLPAPFFREYTAGDLAVRAMGINTIRQMVTGATISSLLSGVFSIFSFAVIFYYSAELGLIAALMAAVIVVVTAAGGFVQLRYQRRETEMLGKVSSLVLQMLTGIAKLRVAGAEMRAFSVWSGQYSIQKANAVRAQAAANALTVFNSISGVLTYMVIFAVVAYVLDGGVSTGEFVAFNTAFAQFLFASAGITTAFTTILQAAPFYERAKPILRTLPEVDTEKPDPGVLRGRVEINQLSFRYDPDGPLVLDNVSLRADPGEFVAIVGPSGAGKSSLFRQLLGFEDPESGSVYYDDHDLTGLNVQAVRRQLGVVLQNGNMMSGTIFQNIAGVSDLTMDQAWEAARMAGLDKDIEMMPMGMFTFLGQGGSSVSGGQRQRLMIARAIATKPRVLLFDEATSALDNRTQAIVSSSLESLKATRIVIAHRLSTIMNADRIYVLEAGRVAQSGTYDELMEQEGPFRDLAMRQIA